jgi:translation initiation factor 3 subunit F
MSQEALFLKTGAAVEVKIHPVVLFTALDAFMRRNDGQKRVIGTLLGYENDGVVEITQCFPVPHKEMKDGEVAVGKDFNRQMLALHKAVSPKEQIVGWFATALDGKLVNKQSCLIHDYYGTECPRPVHLVIDTTLQNNTLAVKAYHSSALSIGNDTVAAQFEQIPVTVTSTEAERTGMEAMLDTAEKMDALSVVQEDDTDRLEKVVSKLLQRLETTCAYVDDVVAGRRPKDREMGRKIAATLSAVPHVKAEQFQGMFDTSVQDLLMVSYLSNLTRTQLVATKKIQSIKIK